jgi:hypothetical protein
MSETGSLSNALRRPAGTNRNIGPLKGEINVSKPLDPRKGKVQGPIIHVKKVRSPLYKPGIADDEWSIDSYHMSDSQDDPRAVW